MSARRGRGRDEDDLPLSRVRPVDDDVRRELEFHLERRTAELIAEGHTPESARAAARDLFGNRDLVESECREIESRRRSTRRRSRRLEALVQDIRVGSRLLRRTPAFTLAAFATLALGIGATTAVFSIVNQVLLRPLPYHEPDRLVDLLERHETGYASVAWANFLDLDAQSRSFNGLASHGSGVVTVLGTGSPMRAEAGWVSKGFFRVFPVQPVLGRLPVPDEFRKGANPVAVVSHAFWRDQLGAPASLEGVRLRMSLDHEVVGVLPPGFDFPNGTQIWRPIELDDQSMSRTSHNWDVVGRLAPGVSLQAAIQDVDAIFARLEPVYAPDFDATGVIMTPLQESLNGSARDPLYLLLGASAVLLLVACSNLAGAMLARGTARAGEIAVRSALGATRLRLVRQLVTESGLLAICGGIGGILLAAALLRTFGALAPGNVRLSDITIDGWVITFAIVASVFTAVTFGLAPAVRLSDSATSGMLREGGRGTSDAGRLRIWNVLVSAEVALAVALLAGSTLLIRSFARVMDARLGFDPGNVLVAEVNLPALNYAGDSPTVAAFHQRVLDRLSANTGIVAAGFSNVPPLGGNNMSGAIEVEGKPLDPRGDYNGYSLYRVVGGEFFAANGIPLLRGRSFTSADDRGAPGVVVVNETFANTEWPGQDPIGKRVRPAGMDRATADYVEPWSTVIGVVGDSRSGSPTDRFRQAFYFDQRQRPPYRARNVTYSVRSTMPPTAVAEIVRQAVHDADPDVPVEIRAMREVISSAVADRRFTMIVLGTFASIAVFLAAIGIFAVVSYSVAQRTREIGVRLALGATPAGVRRLIVGDAMRAVAPGLVIGGMLAAASAGALRSMLYDVSPFDPAALAAAMFVLASAGVASSLIPAIRSTAIDPMVAIRGE